MGIYKDRGDIIRMWGGSTVASVGLGLVKGTDPNVVILPTTDNVEIEGVTVTSQQNERAPILLRKSGLVLVLITGDFVVGDSIVCISGGRFSSVTVAGTANLVAIGEVYNIVGRAITVHRTGNWSYMDIYKNHIVRES